MSPSNKKNCMPPRGEKISQALVHENSGASFVEYTVFLLILAAGLFVITELVGWFASDTFTRVSGEVAATHGKAFQGETADSANSDKSSNRFFAQSPTWYSVTSRLVILVVLLISAGTMWCLLAGPRGQRRDQVGKAEQSLEEINVNEQRLAEKRQDILTILTRDVGTVLNSQMEVRELMSDRVKCVRPQTTRQQVVHLMEKMKLRHVLVRDDDRRLVGIISDRDIRSNKGSTAAGIMTADPMTVPPSSQIMPAISTMMQQRISCLPVVQDGFIDGVLTTTDLMMLLQCTMQVLQKISNPEQSTDSSADQYGQPTPV